MMGAMKDKGSAYADEQAISRLSAVAPCWALLSRKETKMAYFPNGSAGACFDNQCAKCKYGEAPCPINYVQIMFNYDACNNKTASVILNTLVHNDGTCMMFKCFKHDFEIDARQTKLGI